MNQVIPCICLILLFTVLAEPAVLAADEAGHANRQNTATTSPSAQALAQSLLIADTHIDVPYRLQDQWQDVTRSTADGDFDYPRARSGGLDLVFMSIYTPAEYDGHGGNWQLANQLIDGVEALVARAPDNFVLVSDPGQAQAAQQSGQIGLALGMENGAPIRQLQDLEHFYQRGVRYITLAHSKSNALADSSYDDNRQHLGLSDFGRDVVTRMNELGMMVDVSHLSDAATVDVLKVSTKPVIASHSSVRHFTPEFERNLSDDLIKAIADKGGVVQINFGSAFLTEAANQYSTAFFAARDAFMKSENVTDEDQAVTGFSADYRVENPYPYATLDDVVAHIEHVVALTGIEHVGLGSDYDGVGDSLPSGLKDVSDYPNLIAALQAKGYSEASIAKVLSGNVLRVWQQVAQH